jgi:FMN phosphatase YigB (HAD superfamily)
MSAIKVFAFDCFGTVFNMDGFPREEIRRYVDHVRRETFEPFDFGSEWYGLKAHEDSAIGIRWLQRHGIQCWAFSNGSRELIEAISEANGIKWDWIYDPAEARAYKPNAEAYKTVARRINDENEICMVTANPGFGDVEGAAKAGMRACVIRNGVIDRIEDLLGG